MTELIWIEISKKDLIHNLRTIRRRIGPKVLMAPCIKSNAYGHGLIEAGKIIAENGADWLCVNSVWEAEILRKNRIKLPILILGQVPMADLYKIIKLDLRMFLFEESTAKLLSAAAKQAGRTAKVHIKIDSGMSRQGLHPDKLLKFLKQLEKLRNIHIEGLATHFANSDEPHDDRFFRQQLAVFQSAIKAAIPVLPAKPIIHCANSAAALQYPETHFDMVRPGLSVYGYYPSPDTAKFCAKEKIELKPIISLKTKLAAVKNIDKGSKVSYCCTFTASKEMKIALLPIGYYDGLDRKLSNAGHILVRGRRAPIIGRVCMNITIIDVSHIPATKLDDEVVIIGRQGKEKITVEETAINIGTINYEVTTRLRESIPRKVIFSKT